MLSILSSGTLVGIDAASVQVEVNTGEPGEPHTHIVGLPDTAVKESESRVKSSLANNGFRSPQTKTTINLAPGSIRKEGPLFDLPIALGIIASTHQMNNDRLDKYLIAGELSLSGATRPIRGGLALALLARRQNKAGLMLPWQSAEEAALVENIPVYPIRTLHEAVLFLNGELEIQPLNSQNSPFRQPPAPDHSIDFSEIKGQHAVRRAVEIAVAGMHNLLMIGPPGSGKSMIAKRIPSIMPAPDLEEFLEILAIQSAAGASLDAENRCYQRPFRAPHHTISDVGLIGGGSKPGPGEISLAHNGVLFMDELPEFRRNTLEVLRQPLEDNQVTISRAAGKMTFPSSVMLVAAMNPTPSGYSEKDGREVHASPAQIQRYRAKISGPLLDRIDIHIEAPALSFEELRSSQPGESSATMRSRILAARNIQSERFKQDCSSSKNGKQAHNNARMSHQQIRKFCAIDKSLGDLLQRAMEELQLSARAYDRILKVSRTIADLDDKVNIEATHLMEAIQYRNLDRNLFY